MTGRVGDAAGASAAAHARIAEIVSGSVAGSPADAERAQRAAAAQILALSEALVLYAGSNVPLDADSADAHRLGMRPSMGWPAEKLQPGLERLEELEVLTARAVAATMGARFADVRPPSATIANLAAYTGLAAVGSTLAVLPRWAGGHASHRRTPEIRGHALVDLPYDVQEQDVDLERLPAFLRRHRPALIVLGGSLALFPHRLADVAALAGEFDIPVLYDASHTAGLIAGRRFQDPIAEGAAAVTFSTYKSFGGPPGGVVLAADHDTAAAISAAVYPTLTSNYDAGRLPALHAAATELLVDGRRYANACIDAAQALAGALHDEGLELVGASRGFTESHHLAIRLPSSSDAQAAVRRLRAVNIHVSETTAPGPEGPTNALRLGTQEVVRRGLTVRDMPEVAALIAPVVRDGEPPADVADRVHRLATRGV